LGKAGIVNDRSPLAGRASEAEKPAVRRILLTNMHAGLGGGEMVLLDHIAFLREQGVAVALLLLEDGPLAERARRAGAEVRVLPFAWAGGKVRSATMVAGRVVGAVRLLRAFRPELVISYTLNDLVVAGLAARFAAVPMVYRAQGDVFGPAAEGRGTWLGRCLDPVVRFIRPAIVPTTVGEAERLNRRGLGPAAAIPLGVRPPTTEEREAAPELRQEQGWEGERPIVALFGRLLHWKGQDVLLRALGRLRRRGVVFGAWIVGDADFGDGRAYSQELRDLVEQEGLTEEVRFLGFREDVPALMAGCDVVCHASRFEPFGMVVVEAMAAGRPVVASDVSGPRESVVEGETGYLVPPGDAAALAQRLERLLSDPGERTRLGRNGARRAEQHFDRNRNLQAFHERCLDVVGGRRP